MAREPFFQSDATNRFGVAHPLRTSARADQEFLAVSYEQIDRRGIKLASFATMYLQKVIVRQCETESDHRAEDAVKCSLDHIRAEKNLIRIVHDVRGIYPLRSIYFVMDRSAHRG